MNSEEISRISFTYFKEAADAIYCADAAGKFLFVNKSLCGKLGYAEDELMNRHVWDIKHETSEDAWHLHFNKIRSSGCLTSTTLHKTKTGQFLHVESLQNYLKVNDKEMYVSLSRYPKTTGQNRETGSNTEFDAIFEAFPDLLFKLSPQGHILYYKAGKNAELFINPEEFMGKKLQDTLPEKVGKKFHKHLHKVIENRSLESFDYYLKINNRKKWFEARIVPLNDENIVAIIRDITVKREAEKEMYRAEQLYKVLAANLPNGAVFMFDNNLNYTLVAGQAIISLGYDMENMPGKNVKEVIPPHILEVILPKYEAALKGESSSFDLLGNDGRWYICNVLPIYNEKNEVDGGMAVTFDIDKLKHTERDLKESEKVYRTLASHLPNGAVFMFDNKLKFMLAEGQALQQLGFTKEMIEGKQLSQIPIPDTFLKKAEKFCRAALAGRTVNFEMRVYGGRTFYCTGVPIINTQQEIEGGMVVAFDITKQKNTEQELSQHIRELKESEKLYRMLVHNIPNGILMMFDNELKCTLAEGQLIPNLGIPKEEIIGSTPDEIFPEDMAQELIPQYRTALEGKSVTFEMKTKSTDHAYLVSILPLLGSNNSLNGGMIVAFDIDHLKAVEDELQQRVRDLSRLNERLNKEVEIRKKIEANLQEYTAELKNKNQELEQFAYVASHDLQEPLRMISSFTQLLGRRYHNKLDREAEEYINFTIEGASRMQSLINDLLAYSRVGTKGKEFIPVRFSEVINKAVYNLSISISETGAQINYGEMPEILGDESQLVQLIQNLISNAIKFRKDNVPPVIDILAREEPTHYLFSVADNGIGINMEHKERIFQIFQRLHTRDKYPGTGIGLAICKKIVERHGGEIWVESVAGKGTTFYFTIKRLTNIPNHS